MLKKYVKNTSNSDSDSNSDSNSDIQSHYSYKSQEK